MSHKNDWNAETIRVTRAAFLMVGMLAVSGFAAAQTSVPDAQVEANVLKALASAPELANESITTKTVYGTVTLSGSVSGEPARVKAENLAANANGVKKVVDELTLTANGTAAVANNQQSAAPLMLQSDGTYAPAPSASDQTGGQNPAPGTAPATMAQRNNPDADQALDQQMDQQAKAQAGIDPNASNQPANGQQPAPSANTANNQQSYPAAPPPARRPMYAPGYPGYAPYPYGYPQSAPPAGAYAQTQQPGYQQPPMGGQVAGQPVTVPSGSMLRVRINRTLSSSRTPAGTTFDGIVVNDIVANGLVAIPRGATVQGVVVDASTSGALKGRGEMSIKLTQVTLGGKTYPIVSDVWARNGADKTIETVNKTAGLGALGAIVGAVAGGGKGAAIGGGVGAAAGLGSSAASGDGQVFIPAEAIVTFHTTADAQVATVSEQEMQRLAYGAGPGNEQPPVRRVYRVYPGYYPGYYAAPGYYPYPAYGYPNY